jgi:hypothetical protein
LFIEFSSFEKFEIKSCEIVILLKIDIHIYIFRWSSDFITGKFDVEELKYLIDLTAVDSVSLGLLILGAFIIILSIIGLIGACKQSRFFLIIYEIIIILLFLAHGIVKLIFFQ